jgi:hypothetical protein
MCPHLGVDLWDIWESLSLSQCLRLSHHPSHEKTAQHHDGDQQRLLRLHCPNLLRPGIFGKKMAIPSVCTALLRKHSRHRLLLFFEPMCLDILNYDMVGFVNTFARDDIILFSHIWKHQSCRLGTQLRIHAQGIELP